MTRLSQRMCRILLRLLQRRRVRAPVSSSDSVTDSGRGFDPEPTEFALRDVRDEHTVGA